MRFGCGLILAIVAGCGYEAAFEPPVAPQAMPTPVAGAGGTPSLPGRGADAVVARAEAVDQANVGTRHALMHRPAYPPIPYPTENPDDAAKAMLGKVLFWEEQMSGDDTVACGTCHRAAAGGSDPRSAQAEARLAGPDGVLDPLPAMTSDDVRGGLGVVACDATGARTGVTLQVTGRKPPTYLDGMFSGEMFWDGRAKGNFVDPDTGEVLINAIVRGNSEVVGGALESQAVGPFMSPVEMACAGASWPALHRKLEAARPLARARAVPQDMQQFIDMHAGSYPAMFAAAFGDSLKVSPSDADEVINTRRIAFAVATHERRLASDQTPWDRWNAGDASALSPEQVRGYELFNGQANCAVCHTPPLFTDNRYHYLGFHPLERDSGRGGAMGGSTSDAGMMKTPTLRNVGLREPGGLLHQGDGPGHDLATVMTLYNLGGLRNDPGILPAIDHQLVPLNLTPDEIAAVIDFLRVGLTDPRAQAEQAPFDRPMLGSENE